MRDSQSLLYLSMKVLFLFLIIFSSIVGNGQSSDLLGKWVVQYHHNDCNKKLESDSISLSRISPNNLQLNFSDTPSIITFYESLRFEYCDKFVQSDSSYFEPNGTSIMKIYTSCGVDPYIGYNSNYFLHSDSILYLTFYNEVVPLDGPSLVKMSSDDVLHYYSKFCAFKFVKYTMRFIDKNTVELVKFD
jgi:hypothetical protein